jgi:hypothetical protein
MDNYILSRRLCNVLSRIVIVFGAFLLEVSPLKRQVNITLYFLLSKRYFLGFISLFSCVLGFCTTFYVISLKFWG